VHASIPASVGFELEPCFSHRPIKADEERNAIFRRGERHLGIHGRTGAAGRRLGVTAATTVEVHSRAEALWNVIDLLEFFLASRKEL